MRRLGDTVPHSSSAAAQAAPPLSKHNRRSSFAGSDVGGQPEIARHTRAVTPDVDRLAVLGPLCERTGITPEDADAIPYLLVGTVDEIVAKIHAARDRWGITYFAVRELDGFAPVIRALRG